MTRTINGIRFERIAQNGWGPRRLNPMWMFTAADGLPWVVQRHQWVHPTTRWAWRVQCDSLVRTYYVDTLDEIGDIHPLRHTRKDPLDRETCNNGDPHSGDPCIVCGHGA